MMSERFLVTFSDVVNPVVVFDVLRQSGPQRFCIFDVDFAVCDASFEEPWLNAEDFDTKRSHGEPERNAFVFKTRKHVVGLHWQISHNTG